jgi:hypothetical protein
MSDQESNSSETGTPQEIKMLHTLIGEWNVAFETRVSPDAPFVLHQIISRIVPILGGAFLQEHISIPASGSKQVDLMGLLGYDRYRERYRFAWLDNTYAIFDVHEGNWDGKTLVVNNIRSGTTFRFGEQEFFSRMIWRDITTAGFKMESDLSTDAGKIWFTQAKGHYTRRS